MNTDPLLSYLVLALLVVAVGLAALPFLRWRSALRQNELLEQLLASQRRTNRMLERLAAGQDLDPWDLRPEDLRPEDLKGGPGPGGSGKSALDSDDDPDAPGEEDEPWPPSTGSR